MGVMKKCSHFLIFLLIVKFLFGKIFKVLKNMNEKEVMSSINIYLFIVHHGTNWNFLCVFNDSNGLVFGY
jgi:hypothetical protein